MFRHGFKTSNFVSLYILLFLFSEVETAGSTKPLAHFTFLYCLHQVWLVSLEEVLQA